MVHPANANQLAMYVVVRISLYLAGRDTPQAKGVSITIFTVIIIISYCCCRPATLPEYAPCASDKQAHVTQRGTNGLRQVECGIDAATT